MASGWWPGAVVGRVLGGMKLAWLSETGWLITDTLGTFTGVAMAGSEPGLLSLLTLRPLNLPDSGLPAGKINHGESKTQSRMLSL